MKEVVTPVFNNVFVVALVLRLTIKPMVELSVPYRNSKRRIKTTHY